MKITEVPQDYGMGGHQKEVCYAVDENGKYVLAPSLGWDPKNISNSQAWELIDEQLADVSEKIHAGILSPLAYHMTKHQMNPALLAKYAGLFRWTVHRHLKSHVFADLSQDQLKRYADVFNISVTELKTIPNQTDQTDQTGS